jgi:tight adherence protein C
MIRSLLTGAGFGFGLWLAVRGWFPAPVGLKTRLSRFSDGDANTPLDASETVIQSAMGRPALWLLRAVRGELIYEIEADVAITGGSLQDHAIDKLKAGLGGVMLVPLMAYAARLVRSPFAFLILALIGFVVGYFLPDFELKQKAATRRQEFNEVLTGFVGLIAVSISGGGGINTAMIDTTGIGDGWCFEALREALDEAILVGETPWNAFERLGRRLNVMQLVELSSALSLAGTSGARVVDTLRARAESGRERELADAMAKAQKKSESMSIPVAAMLLGWFGFLGYPAVANLIGT